MATGDSALTAVFVGTEVGITHGDKTKELLLEKCEGGGLEWSVPRGRARHAARPFKVQDIPALVGDGFDLCVTGSALQAGIARTNSRPVPFLQLGTAVGT